MRKAEQVFAGNNGKVSSKRVIGTIIIAIAMVLAIDSHFTDRDLNDAAFNSMMYTGGIMIVGGVLEDKMGGKSRNWRSARKSSLNEREDHINEQEDD